MLYVGKAKSLRPRVRSYFQRTPDTRAQIAQLPARVDGRRGDRDRDRGGGAPPRAEPRQASPAAVQHPPARRQVLPVHRRHGRGRLPARHVHARAPPARASGTSARTPTRRRCARRSTCSTASSSSGRARGRSQGATRGSRASTTTSSAAGRRASGTSRRRSTGRSSTASSSSSRASRRRSCAELEERMREAAREERFEEAARYRNRLKSVQHLAERQAADRRSVGTVDVIGIAAEGDRAAVQIFPLRGGKLVDRHSFHLENVAGQDLTTVLEAFCRRVLRLRAEHPAAARRAAGRRRRLGARGVPLGAARLTGRGAGGRARREAAPAGAGDPRTRGSRSTSDAGGGRAEAPAPRRGARGAARGAEPREPPAADRVLRHLEHPGRGGRRLDGRLPGRGAEEGALPQVRACAASTGRTTSPRWGRSSSRRFARLGDVSAEEYDESFASPPNLVVVDGGKGQLAAALEAMQRFDLPRVAVIALAKREEEVFVPGQSEPIRLDRSSPGLQLLQRIRDEAHRFAVGFHRQRREKRGFESIFDTLQGVGPARRRALIAHFGSVEGVLAAIAGGARGRARRAREDRALDLRAAAQGRTRHEARARRAARARLRRRAAGRDDEDDGAPVAAAAGAEDRSVGTALVVLPRGGRPRATTAALWAALSPQTQETMGPTYADFRRGLAADLRDELARQTGPPYGRSWRAGSGRGASRPPPARASSRSEEEPYAYAAAFRRVGGRVARRARRRRRRRPPARAPRRERRHPDARGDGRRLRPARALAALARRRAAAARGATTRGPFGARVRARAGAELPGGLARRVDLRDDARDRRRRGAGPFEVVS